MPVVGTCLVTRIRILILAAVFYFSYHSILEEVVVERSVS